MWQDSIFKDLLLPLPKVITKLTHSHLKNMSLNLPLMRNNITREDLDVVIAYLQQEDPILTQSSNVRAFEEEWSKWLGVKYSVFVNSGSSANFISMLILKSLSTKKK